MATSRASCSADASARDAVGVPWASARTAAASCGGRWPRRSALPRRGGLLLAVGDQGGRRAPRCRRPAERPASRRPGADLGGPPRAAATMRAVSSPRTVVIPLLVQLLGLLEAICSRSARRAVRRSSRSFQARRASRPAPAAPAPRRVRILGSAELRRPPGSRDPVPADRARIGRKQSVMAECLGAPPGGPRTAPERSDGGSGAARRRREPSERGGSVGSAHAAGVKRHHGVVERL